MKFISLVILFAMCIGASSCANKNQSSQENRSQEIIDAEEEVKKLEEQAVEVEEAVRNLEESLKDL